MRMSGVEFERELARASDRAWLRTLGSDLCGLTARSSGRCGAEALGSGGAVMVSGAADIIGGAIDAGAESIFAFGRVALVSRGDKSDVCR